ncbi:hypothetical protein KIN20_000142 [Parelaphostrongylus tenuis]|uniref:Choline/carnitine acyltransferase domain-containing protein n=1 Tax=Parelaphostrongylus tenuis TaxID=148309 RepID=A0AAD5LUZ8_PARTN|nr:hypothetical protein KIN20_000142 [Parelaphostrongylus tenuis]
MTDFICDRILASDFKIDTTTSEEQVRRLDFELNDSQKAQIKNSERQLDWVADDLDVAVYTFKRYGKNFPKSVKLSPDSFIQMAFQLAFYRIHSTLPPTYETATLRKFSEGRTENIRSPNILAENFVKKFTSSHVPIVEIYDALKAAADSHKNYTLECMNGRWNGSASSCLESSCRRKQSTHTKHSSESCLSAIEPFPSVH